MFWEATPWSLCSSPELEVQADTCSRLSQAGETTSCGSASRIPFGSFCSFLAILSLASGDKDHQPSPTQHLMLAFQTSGAFWPVAQGIVFTSSLRDSQG